MLQSCEGHIRRKSVQFSGAAVVEKDRQSLACSSDSPWAEAKSRHGEARSSVLQKMDESSSRDHHAPVHQVRASTEDLRDQADRVAVVQHVAFIAHVDVEPNGNEDGEHVESAQGNRLAARKAADGDGLLALDPHLVEELCAGLVEGIRGAPPLRWVEGTGCEGLRHRKQLSELVGLALLAFGILGSFEERDGDFFASRKADLFLFGHVLQGREAHHGPRGFP
eukprot:scaffold3385_cov241-Pinguiococcus_pyrenoidosus.AAC.5